MNFMRNGKDKGDFRGYLEWLDKEVGIKKITTPCSRYLEIPFMIKREEPNPVLFNSIMESNGKVVSNIVTKKSILSKYFNIREEQFLDYFSKAIKNPTQPEYVERDLTQYEVLKGEELDLTKLPLLYHLKEDGGYYITGGVWIAGEKGYVQNLSFHRAMVIDRNRLAVRVVEGRDFHRLLTHYKKMRVAVCIGVPPQILLGASTSIEFGINEMEIANTLIPLKVTKAVTFDSLIPLDCEFIMEGTVDIDERVEEGPFLDLTETYDIVRKQPVMTVDLLYFKKEPIWYAILPGGVEHKFLMGTPREVTIMEEVRKRGVECLDVKLSRGGCNWLHAIVKIRKRAKEDPQKVFDAVLKAHPSCKHLFVVDEDIDISNPEEIEWAMATRFQGDRDIIMLKGERGSSLDPSADPYNYTTTKCLYDLTIPEVNNKTKFYKILYSLQDKVKDETR